MCGGTTPVVGTGHSECGGSVHGCRNQHGFVAWQDGLAEGNYAAGIVDNADICGGRLTVRLIRERLGYLSVAVAVESAVL